MTQVRPDGASLRPAVAGRNGGAQLWLIGAGAAVLGLIVFLWLSGHRTQAPGDLGAARLTGETMIASPPAAPADVTAVEAAGRGQPALAPPPAVPATPTVKPPAAPLFLAPHAPTAAADPPARAPVLIVDLSPGGTESKADAAAAHAEHAEAALSGDEKFAARIEAAQPDRSRATVLVNRGQVVAQGTLIPAVLETALNSDLPGYARAVVSRDVRSFDGSSVLIPRGSRVIGEYHSGLALGQSRAFVVWNRLLRPDGVSIQIGSPATDPLGRAGLSGRVNRHFLENFSGAALLTALDAGGAAIGGAPRTQVVIGSAAPAAGVASAAEALVPGVIPPTVNVPQGAPIRIFVARDLDFSSLAGGAP